MTSVTERFRLVRPLGEGGMGVVWEASSITTGERVAIKVLREREYTPELEKRFLREAEAANAVKHPGILRVHEILHDATGMPAFVMDLLDGEPLVARLERETKLGLGQTAAILLPVIAAVRAAHAAGVVHRDLKPDNVYLTREADGRTGLRVLDFGIARLVQPSEKLTVTGTLMGTPLYMSPEQAAGEAVDVRTDFWSLGALVFECLTGLTVVQGINYGQILTNLIRRNITTLASLETSLPADVVAAVDGLLVERERRPDLGALETALARHADATIAPPPAGLPVVTSSANTETLFEAPLVRKKSVRPAPVRTVAIAATFGMMLVIGLGLGSVALLARGRRPAVPAVSAITVDVPTASVGLPPVLPPEPVADKPPPPVASVVASASARPALRPVMMAEPSRRPAPPPSGPERISGGVAGGKAPF